MTTVDLNADLGEGFGVWLLTDDDALLPLVTSANVACGFHAGDPVTMRRVCSRAAELGVTVGAQVSYRDLAGFGRRRMEISPDELGADVLYQLGALDAMCRATGTRVRYVKPHGALYNTCADDDERAAAVVAAVAAYDASLPLLGLPGSALLQAAERAGLRGVREGFPDRGYTAEGRLVPRDTQGALVADPDEVAERAVLLATEGAIVAVDGTRLAQPVDSLCLHGDSPAAVAAARRCRAALTSAGVDVAPFIDVHTQ